MAIEKGEVINPEGKGGFGDNPDHRANGRWTKETSIPYNQNRFLRMSISEFLAYEPKTMAEVAAWNSVSFTRSDLAYLKEVTDRTEGKPAQSIDLSTLGKELNHPVSGFTSDEREKILNAIDKSRTGEASKD